MSEQARLRRQRFSRMLFMLFKRGRCEGRVLPRVSLSRRRHGGRSGGGRRGIFRGAFPHQEAQLRLYLEAGQGVFLTYQAFSIQQAHCPGCPLSARGSGKCAWNCRKQAANHEKTLVAARFVQTLGGRIPKRCLFPNKFLAILHTCDERAALVARSRWCQAYSRVLREILQDTDTQHGRRRFRAARARR